MTAGDGKTAAPPPAYTADAGPSTAPDPDPGAGVDVTAAFASLDLQDGIGENKLPDADTCLAHLKLLFAIENMKHDVGYTNGLFGLWDSRAILKADLDTTAGKTGEKEKASDKEKGKEMSEPSQLDEETLKYLSQIREKRWSLFVARAVDRYEAWWNSVADAHPGPKSRLRESDMAKIVDWGQWVRKYESFPTIQDDEKDIQEFIAKAVYLMPLDVLMVWHAHMLNPRAYLEDCLRAQYGCLWRLGFPWKAVTAYIDNDTFEYDVPLDVKQAWTKTTRRPWSNIDGSNTKAFRCQGCGTESHFPWTSCQAREGELVKDPCSLKGTGYGDVDMQQPCRCGLVVSRDVLSVSKFVSDTKSLLHTCEPMSGTILHPQTGVPTASEYAETTRHSPTFPNRMIKTALRSEILTLVSRGNRSSGVTMNNIRQLIEAVLQNDTKLREINGFSHVQATRKVRLKPLAHAAIRRMMARYWDNTGPFALDLVGAVLRQGVFCAKMCKIDWLHSPAAAATMKRLIIKYDRFMGLVTNHSDQLWVPTLDVDLAWHTHQLSPKSYYAFTTCRCSKYIDHDDKIAEDKLGESFATTSKEYQDRYGEIYSECTCWYCEAIRASTTSSVGSVLKLSKQDKVNEQFYESGKADLCPPPSADMSAHISSHNSVRVEPPPYASDTERRAWITRYARMVHQKRIVAGHAKAMKKAAKKGRKADEKNERYADHWGYRYAYAYPWAFPMWYYPYGFYPGIAYASPAVNGDPGAGGCAGAAGACGSGGGGCGGGCGGGGCGGGGCGGGDGGGGGCGGGS